MDNNSYNGIIIKGVGGLYTVECGNVRKEMKARGLFRKQNITPLVGDWVTVSDGVISSIKERKNSFLRPPCANIDKLFIVVALCEPQPDTYNIDKMIALAYNHNVEPILVFSKLDLTDIYGIREIYSNVPIKKIDICSVQNKGSDEIKKEITDNVCVLCGVSGVGKSTLINLLSDADVMQTGAISDRLRRGKNTTRHVELFDLCGGRIADTPGFSNILSDYFDIKDRNTLRYLYPEFEKFEGKCKFSDCSHTGEPGCSVFQAVQNREISQIRYDNYKKMYEEIGPLKLWEIKK